MSVTASNLDHIGSVYATPNGGDYVGLSVAQCRSMTTHSGRRYYYSGGQGLWPNTNLTLNSFVGTSPIDEWNCNCACDCGGCFLAGSLVRMFDGFEKLIEHVRIGDVLLGRNGLPGTVLAYDCPLLGDALMYRINGEHETTGGHGHFGPNGLNVVTKDDFAFDRNAAHRLTYDDGRVEFQELPDLDPALIHVMGAGSVLYTLDGETSVMSIEPFRLPPETQLYHFKLDGAQSYFVNGYLVSGWYSGDE